MQVDSGTAELAQDLDLPGGWALLVNGTAQSYVDLDDPTHLEFEYVRRLGHLVELAAPQGSPLRALHLGGGGLTLPRFVAATRPGSEQRVVEVDARLVDLVLGALPLDPRWPVTVDVADARAALAGVPDGSMDLLVVDVYAGPRVPAHLTSVEFLRSAARVLAPGGCYAANLADSTPLAFSRAQVATALAVFEHTCMVLEPDVLRGRRFGNVVLMASRRALPLDGLARRLAGDPFPATLVHGRALEVFTEHAEPVTDATATPSPRPPPGSFGVPLDD